MKVITEAFQKLKLFAKVKSISTYKIYKKGEIILHEGDINDCVFYIISGLARSCYSITDEEISREISSWFFKEFDLMNIPSSYVFEKPSPEAIVALENCHLLVMKKHDLEILYKESPELNHYARLASEEAVAMMDERIRNFVGLTPEQRYEAFRVQFKEVEARIPLKYIASFIGIDPATLSRVRGKR